jgi:hypothetical protein
MCRIQNNWDFNKNILTMLGISESLVSEYGRIKNNFENFLIELK